MELEPLAGRRKTLSQIGKLPSMFVVRELLQFNTSTCTRRLFPRGPHCRVCTSSRSPMAQSSASTWIVMAPEMGKLPLFLFILNIP